MRAIVRAVLLCLAVISGFRSSARRSLSLRRRSRSRARRQKGGVLALASAVLAGVVAIAAAQAAGPNRPLALHGLQKKGHAGKALFDPAAQPGAREDKRLRTATSRTFVGRNGTLDARIYPFPVNYRDAHGHWQAIDDTLVPDAGGYRNKANSLHMQLPGDAGSYARLDVAGQSAAFALVGAQGSGATSAATETFHNALHGVSVSNTAQNTGLEQLLTLADRDAQSSFVYALWSAGGLTPRQVGQQRIDFVDGSGRTRFSFAAPLMHDSSGSAAGASGPLNLRLVRHGGAAFAVLTPNRAWLANPARKFPVVVDPGMTHIENRGDTRLRESGADQDCYLESGSGASTSFCGGTTLNVGYDGTHNFRALLQFNVQNTIPSNANVLNAEFGMHEYGSSGSSTVSMDVDQLTRAWTTAATWNTYDGTHAWTSAGGDYGTPAAATNNDVYSTTGDWFQWYPTSLVKGWVNGSIANDGILVRDTTESQTNNLFNFDSTASTRDNYNDSPYLDVVYAPQTGQPGYFRYLSQQLDDRMNLGVNVASGNLMVANNDSNIAGVAGFNQTINRYFNSQWERNTQDIGTGWTLGSGADVNLRFLSDGTAVFDGPSAYEVTFAPPSGSSNVYKSPTGVDATLCQYNSTSCPGDTGGGSSPAYVLTFNHSQHRYSFSSAGQLISEQDRNHNPIRYYYNASGQLTSIKDTESRTTTVNYTNGLISSIVDWSGRTTSYGYTNGDLTSYTDANNKTTQYQYDSSDDITQITDPNGNITKIGYDGDPSDRVTSITRVTNTQNGTGPTWTYSYQGVSSPCASPGDYGKTVVTDPNSNQTTYCVDSMGRVTKVQDANGNTESTSYDAGGNPATGTTAMGHQSTFNFDTAQDSNGNRTDNPLSAQAPSGDGTLAGAKVQYTYNATQTHSAYLPYTYTGANGQQTTYGYDTIGNMTIASTAMGGTNPADQVSLTYNSNGTVATSTDGNGTGHTTTYSYDPSNPANLITILEPNPGSCVSGSRNLCWSFGYDNLGRVTSMTDGNGNQTTYSYDQLDRLTKITYQNGSSVQYSYDADGNRTQRIDSTGTTTYSYDALNRRTQDVYPGTNGGTNTYTYDGASNLQTLTNAWGTTTYGYDHANRLTSIQFPTGTVSCSGTMNDCVTYGYNNDNQRTTATFPGGTVETSTYDQADRLQEISAAQGSTKLTDFKYTYKDPTTGKDADVFATRTDLAGNATTYGYDQVGRLLTSSTNLAGGGTDNYTYSYDGAGNMLTQTHNGATTTFAYNNANELCWRYAGSSSNGCGSAPTGATTYNFDLNGNQTGSSDGRSFSYNQANQQTDYTPPGSWDHQATFAGPDQREMTSYDGIAFLYNLMGMSTRTNTNTGTVMDYVREPNGSIVAQGPDTDQYYLRDGHGSIVGIVDANGTFQDKYTYDPEGTPLTDNGQAFGNYNIYNPWLYQSGYGYYSSATTGLYKAGYRWNDPTAGNWTQQDAIAQPTQVRSNLYSAMGDDAVNNADPAGLCSGFTDCLGAAAATVGGVVSTGVAGGATIFATAGCFAAQTAVEEGDYESCGKIAAIGLQYTAAGVAATGAAASYLFSGGGPPHSPPGDYSSCLNIGLYCRA